MNRCLVRFSLTTSASHYEPRSWNLNMVQMALHKNSNGSRSKEELQRSSQISAQGCFNPGSVLTATESTPKEFANAFSVVCATR